MIRPTISLLLLIAIVILLHACDSQPPTAPDKTLSSSSSIQDIDNSVTTAASNISASAEDGHGGVEGFSFLPPLVENQDRAGTLDSELLSHLAVEICEWTKPDCGEIMARFTTEDKGSERLRIENDEGTHYHVNFHTRKYQLQDGGMYRLRVLVAGTEVGYATLKMSARGKGKEKSKDKGKGKGKNKNKARTSSTSGDNIAVKNGRTLPIKFRIAEGAVSVATPEGGTTTAGGGAITLDIPPDALSESVGITAEPADDLSTHDRLVPGAADRKRLQHRSERPAGPTDDRPGRRGPLRRAGPPFEQRLRGKPATAGLPPVRPAHIRAHSGRYHDGRYSVAGVSGRTGWRPGIPGKQLLVY